MWPLEYRKRNEQNKVLRRIQKTAIDLMVKGSGKSLGVSVWSLKQWRKAYLRENQDDLRRRGKMSAEEQLRILRGEKAELRMDNKILKKFAAFCQKRTNKGMVTKANFNRKRPPKT